MTAIAKWRNLLLRSCVAWLSAVACAHVVAQPVEPDDLLELSLEQLGDVEVTSVSRRAERLADAAASVYVISGEDIRRAGALNLPEALRLAPNLQVARVSATAYAISARGFNNSLGNKLLVLIDGRTVYTPLFSGVFWDAQDVLLEEVERIEVISGPGATLWGANAVNGVINVSTRRASASRGGYAGARAGSDARSAAVRYGGAAGPDGSYRVYARRERVSATHGADGGAQADAWARHQFGFRVDWGSARDGLTLQGDRYQGESEPRPFGPIRLSGDNLLLAWNRVAESGARFHLQAYHDRTDRHDPILFHDRMRVLDVEFLHDLMLGAHRVVWGGGHRRARDEVDGRLLATFLPPRRDLRWSNLFVQDEWQVAPSLTLAAGLKLDRNVYTGTERLPSLRAAWKRSDTQLVWASLSRAVRAPSRIDREFFFPGAPPYLITGGPDFRAEVSDVLELGFRTELRAGVSFSATAFEHRHDLLRSGEPQPDGTFQVRNGTEGRTRGIEAWANFDPAPAWNLSAGVLLLRHRFRTKPGSNDPDGPVDLGNDPRHQWSLRSTYQPRDGLELQASVRRVGQLPDPVVPAYTAIDAGLIWRVRPEARFALFLRNLGGDHAEFAPGPLVARSEYGREAALEFSWHW
jgi:iron complex outermembrane receptor protein